MEGVVNFYHEGKSWGFILGQDGESYFCHGSNILRTSARTLTAGNHVSFDLQPVAGKKPQAINIFVLDGGEPAGPEQLEPATIIWWALGRGFGKAITRHDRIEVFVHARRLPEHLQQAGLVTGQQVELTFMETSKGPEALKVVIP
jgi:cold shock CspA family protein